MNPIKETSSFDATTNTINVLQSYSVADIQEAVKNMVDLQEKRNVRLAKMTPGAFDYLELSSQIDKMNKRLETFKARLAVVKPQ